jgi:hypothetical protein
MWQSSETHPKTTLWTMLGLSHAAVADTFVCYCSGADTSLLHHPGCALASPSRIDRRTGVGEAGRVSFRGALMRQPWIAERLRAAWHSVALAWLADDVGGAVLLRERLMGMRHAVEED